MVYRLFSKIALKTYIYFRYSKEYWREHEHAARICMINTFSVVLSVRIETVSLKH